jgi:hypothetical protein
LKSPNGRDHSENLGVDGTIMDLREIGCKGVNWTHMAQERDRWQALVNTVMNFAVS